MSRLNDAAWSWLRRELDAWGEAGLTAEFWWRDDDAVAAGAELERLAALARQWQVPLALAVIPAKLEASLAGFARKQKLLTVLQHGCAHENNALPGERKLELGGNAGRRQLLECLRRGAQSLADEFDTRYLPVLVPPWNRIDPDLIGSLGRIGFCGISTTRARRADHPARGLLQVNTHLDPVHWQNRRRFVGIYPAIALLIQHLRAKRLGYRDRGEPTGLLTHHLAHDEAVWRFTEDLLRFVCEHPAAAWLGAPAIWHPAKIPPS